MPTYANWPVFKQIFSFLAFLLNLIFDGLEQIGVVNVALSVVFFSLFIQLLLLPIQICRGIQRGKKSEGDRQMSLLKERYEGDLSNLEYIEKKNEIRKKYGEKKGAGCLFTIIQMMVLLLSFGVLGSMNESVTVLSGLSEEGLARAYTTFGINFALSTNEDPWPNVLLVVFYLLLQFLPDIIRKIVARRNAFKKATEGMTEEEKEKYREEHRFNIHKDGFLVFQVVTSIAFPCLIASASLMLPGYYLWYWILGTFWRPLLFKCAKKMKEACRRRSKPQESKM